MNAGTAKLSDMNNIFNSYAQVKKCILADDSRGLRQHLLATNHNTRTSAQLNLTLSNLLLVACQGQKFQSVLVLLADGRADPRYRQSLCLRYSTRRGFVNISQILIDDGRVDATACDSQALQDACMYGHSEVVKSILAKTAAKPSDLSLRTAVAKGYFNIVQALIKDGRANPSSHGSSALIKAAALGKNDILQVLLEDGRADPASHNNMAIVRAAKWGHFQCVKLLLQDARTDPAVDDHKVLHYLVELTGRYRAYPPRRRGSFLQDAIAFGRGKQGLAEGLQVIRMFLQDPRTHVGAQGYQLIVNKVQLDAPGMKPISAVTINVDNGSSKVESTGFSLFWGTFTGMRTEDGQLLTGSPVPVEVKQIVDELRSGALPKIKLPKMQRKQQL